MEISTITNVFPACSCFLVFETLARRKDSGAESFRFQLLSYLNVLSYRERPPELPNRESSRRTTAHLKLWIPNAMNQCAFILSASRLECRLLIPQKVMNFHALVDKLKAKPAVR